MNRRADTRFPIHDLIAARQSPLAFQDRAVAPVILGSLFEAARWAPSSFNEQPWYFAVARREDRDGFERLASCLVEANARWATKAPVLALSIAKLSFARNGKPNRHAWHDVGLAVGGLLVQAQALGLGVHQMAGFDPVRARTALAIPPGCEPVAMIAIGFPDTADALPPDLAERERAPRARQQLASFVFGARFGTPLRDLE